MKKNRLRALCCLLALMLLLSSLASCKKSGQEGANTNTGIVDSDLDNVDLWAQLPKTNYGGEEINILIASEHSYEFAEALNGQLVNDEVYKREIQIESEYGVSLLYYPELGMWVHRDSFNSLIRNDITSGYGSYDLIDGINSIAMMLTTEGLFKNFNDIDCINFDDPWWTHKAYESMQIAGKLYGITGSSMLSTYKEAYCIYVNTALLADNQMDVDPIQLTIDGKWTLEKLLQITVGMEKDINNDGQMTSTDFFGFISTDVPFRGFQTAFQLDVIKRTNSGKLYYTAGDEKWYNAVDEMRKLTGDSDKVYIEKAADADAAINVFGSNRAIVFNGTLAYAEQLIDYSEDFVIVPQPKYDEDQERYRVQMGTATGQFFIPKTADFDMIGAIINAHGCLSYLKVVPKYYEDMLKTRYINIPKNAQVIDIINESMTMDITYAFNTVIYKNQTQLFWYHTVRGDDPASMFERTSSYMPPILEELYTTFSNHD